MLLHVELELFYTEAAVEIAEGADAMVCMRLGGAGWLTLQRELTINLDSDGGKLSVRVISLMCHVAFLTRRLTRVARSTGDQQASEATCCVCIACAKL